MDTQGKDQGVKLTKAQRRALEMVARRDWPAGEPRLGWIPRPTASVLLRHGLIVRRGGSEKGDIFWNKSPVVDLTPAGRQALEQQS